MPNDAAPRTTDLHFLTIAEAASLIERRQLSPVALTRAFLDRIAAIDPQLNAYLLVTADQALDQAASRKPRSWRASIAVRCTAFRSR